ncbi:dedicator of cytokinesis protein 7 isoform X2 [Diaphorina citri]|jgi:Dedicator of cytokinesis./Domain of unknown function (DUF3398).|uniref:Dedicator of cytokinesis protein 7 isoform X2 n=1 Tax=Diaphorina citri TaxID=121845 RepID=A0A3Q0IY64_DIACI|nr:dedicator of cytokinesis protein 7 isoform X2 [Diaphorina citri]
MNNWLVFQGLSNNFPFSHYFQITDVVDPIDYEDFILQQSLLIDRDPLKHLLEFPVDDIQVCVLPRKIRTVKPLLPKEPLSELEPHVRECIECYTRNWIYVDYRYRHFSTSSWFIDRTTLASNLPRQEFEVDMTPLPNGRVSPQPSYKSQSSRDSRVSSSGGDTPRGSWASFDLLNSVSDPLIVSLLERIPSETIDQLNEVTRQEGRQDVLFSLYSTYQDDEPVEKRCIPNLPCEPLGHRILIKCLQLKLELDVEPMFATLALYDCRERKKVSENFYFDMNSENNRHMLSPHIPYVDCSTTSHACILNITHASPDLFLVIKLDKVLQGDINECAEPYMKDERNIEKVRQNAAQSCERLGKYRMPFAWTAVYLMNVINGVSNIDGDCDSQSSNSLDRKSSGGAFDQLRKRASDSSTLTRRGSLERRSNSSDKRVSWNLDDLDSFRPVTLTVSSFFKQESDKLRDEDLYKFLQDLKKPCSLLKKLKSIPGCLKLDISPCPDEVKWCLTPELAEIVPRIGDKGRPIKEILEFPLRETNLPHYLYRNLLFVYPKEINFTGRTGSARNLTVKVQLMYGETPESALPAIFGKSSCPEFTTEAYTSVIYHNKCPYVSDEIKIQLPPTLEDKHHLLFTFYHISCQKKLEQNTVETPVGYTWLPLLKDGQLQLNDFCLPVTLEAPPPNYSYITPDVLLPGLKWVDNHKSIFNVVLSAASSIHPQDTHIHEFLSICDKLETGGVVSNRLPEINFEAELRQKILNLVNCKLEPLIKFLTIILNKLIYLMTQPLCMNGQSLCISQTVFEVIGLIIKFVSAFSEDESDACGRHPLLTSYVTYQCCIPHPDLEQKRSNMQRQKSSSNPDLQLDIEVQAYNARGLDRTCSMKAGQCADNFASGSKLNLCKILHEEIGLQWVVSSSTARENAMSHAWFFFDLMAKSMVEHLSITETMDSPRKMRFSDQYMEDIATLVTSFTSDIIAYCHKDYKLTRSMNTSLAFFLFDLFSFADRSFVFLLIKTYYKHVTAKISSLPDSIALSNLKLEFLRVVCSHEHFVPLNLPFGTVFTANSSSTSPSPSTNSSTSQSSYMSSLISKDKSPFAELSLEFKQQHYLVGLILSEFAAMIEVQNHNFHNRIVTLITDLMASHDCDARFVEPEAKARVAALYLPYIALTMDMLPNLHSGNDVSRIINPTSEESVESGLNQSVAMAIAGTSMFGIKTDNYKLFQQTRKVNLSMDNTKNILICFLWILKNMDKDILKQWWAEMPVSRLNQLLQVLGLCVSCFEYKGKTKVKPVASVSQKFANKTVDMKSKLEDVILGQGSARSEMMQRRKDKNLGMDKLRWRKDQMIYKSTLDMSEKPKTKLERNLNLEGNLATEVSFTILNTLELIVQVVQQCDHLHGLLGSVMKILLHAFSCNQSTAVMQSMFSTQRSLVFKFPNLLFDEETEQCADLCLQLLKHSSSNLSLIRTNSAASLYLLMRQNFEIGNNFARVKMQVTMSLSSLVGTSQSFNETSLRRSLKTILLYSEQDRELEDTTFPEQVKDLVFNLHMILSDTVKMKEFQEDPEMLLDLMYRIAKGYQNSPNLRLTWLANMAQKHMERNNHTEAGMCLVHSAALVAEYLHMIEEQPYLPLGAVSLEFISPNCLEECAVSDDVLSPEQEGVCLGKDFTESGFVCLLEHAASSFYTAGMYETVNNVYKVIFPIVEKSRDYKKLSNIHSKLHDAYVKLYQIQGKRVFGTYFRVGFYGMKFGDLNNEEFIYKEPTLTKLPEIFSRLENFYAERFGVNNIMIIKDSNPVDTMSLDPDIAYIQITYVEPYFENYEKRYRETHFEQNFNIKTFMYATPFTTTGKAHGELHEQYKRKTILTTATHFPYVKTRIQVVDRKQIILTPIEVAIEDIQKKTQELSNSIRQEPPDPKILQMVLQGCIGTTVNQGPMEMAVVFLSDLLDGEKSPTKLQNKLRLCFKDFSKKCCDALRKNKTLIGPDQKDYQKELERNYHRFTDKLMPLITFKHIDKLMPNARNLK